MQKTESVLSVGLDVSKSSLETAILFVDETHLIKSFSNNKEGIRDLIRWLNQQGVTCVTPCVIESTGDFHLLSAITLSNNKFTVNVINPIITNHYQKTTVRDAKTDKIDALRLAKIGQMEKGLIVFSATKEDIAKKKFLTEIALLEQMKQQYVSSVKSTKETNKILGLGINCAGAQKLIKQINKRIDNLYLELQALTPERAKKIARENPGVSERQMAVIATVFGNAHFENRDQVVAYVGLDIRKRESGNWHGKEHISKRGNPFARKVLFQIGWGLAMHNEKYKEHYKNLRNDGKHYYTCLLSVARKFLRFLFAVYLQDSALTLKQNTI